MKTSNLAGALLAFAVALALPEGARAAAPAAPPTDSAAPKGSLATAAPLGSGRVAMLLGGGVAVLFPFYEIAIGYGITERVDLVARFETVLGLLHYPRLGVRWSPVDIGRWKLGVTAGASYSFFGLATDQVNLTSTFYLTGEIAISGPLTQNTDLVLAVDNELDLLYFKRIEGKDTVGGTFRYDAAVPRLGIRTNLTDDLDAFLQARVRVPVETLQYRATGFLVLPFLEVGGAWGW